jgi:glycosyltransferase involved in cell wall biosynthesis
MERGNQHGHSLSFVIAVNNEKVLEQNALASPVFKSGHQHEILVRRGFASASAAYNDAISTTTNDIIVFMHQDIYLPDGWDERLTNSVVSLEKSGEKWGVLGCFGMSLEGAPVGYVYSNGLRRELGSPQPPTRVQSLDEIVLVVRKSSGLQFDEMLPHFHLYGTDICLEAQRMGLRNYVVANYCIHNSLPVLRLPPEFWRCAEYLQKKWRRALPISTTCIVISTSKAFMRLKRIESWFASYQRRFNKLDHQRLSSPALPLVAQAREKSDG